MLFQILDLQFELIGGPAQLLRTLAEGASAQRRQLALQRLDDAVTRRHRLLALGQLRRQPSHERLKRRHVVGRPSARMWILVEKPPRERPSTSLSIPLFAAGLLGASRALMSADHGAVHEVQARAHPALVVGTGLQGFQDALPDAGAAPAVEPARHRAERPVTL
nr:hypothetical protein [Azospirillum oryzae]